MTRDRDHRRRGGPRSKQDNHRHPHWQQERSSRQNDEEEWRQQLKRMRLRETAESPVLSLFQGHLRGQEVRLERRIDRKPRSPCQWAVQIKLPKVPSDFGFETEGTWSGIAQLVGVGDVPTGDVEFDADVHLRGRLPALLTVLDARTRSQVRSWVARGATLKTNLLTWSHVTHDPTAPSVLYQVSSLAALSARLVPPTNLQKALLERLVSETDPGVQLQIGSQLAHDFEKKPILAEQVSEEVLLRLLGQLSEPALLIALETLARSGSKAAIAPILALSRQFLTRTVVRKASADAAAAIGARTGALSGGELSVAGQAEAGEVSLAAEEGTLHLPADEA